MLAVGGEKATNYPEATHPLITLWHGAPVKCQEDQIQCGEGDDLIQEAIRRLGHTFFALCVCVGLPRSLSGDDSIKFRTKKSTCQEQHKCQNVIKRMSD